MKKINDDLKIKLLAILACFLWSTAFVGIKIGLQYSKPLSFAGLRFIISGLMIIPFCGNIVNYFKVVKNNIRTIFILSIFQTFLLYGMFYIGMTLVKGALAAIIVGFSPLTAAITAHFFMKDDKMSLAKTLSIFIGIIGIVIISLSRKPWIATGFYEVIGIVIIALSTFSSAFGNVIVSKDKKNIDPLILNSSQIFLGGIFLLILSIPFEGIPKIIKIKEFYFSLLWLSFISAFAFSIWFTLLKRKNVKVSDINVLKFIVPVSGAILSWIILPDDNPEIFQIIGMICVAFSVISYNFFQKEIKEYE